MRPGGTCAHAVWPGPAKAGGVHWLGDQQNARSVVVGASAVSEVVQAWAEQLIIHATGPRFRISNRAEWYAFWQASHNTSTYRSARRRAFRHPMPPNVSYVACRARSCVVATGCDGETARADAACGPFVRSFYDTAMAMPPPTTDKVRDHAYEISYGSFVLPLSATRGRPLKMLEIGLGCNMAYGPGASVRLWKTLLPNATLWEAEYDRPCVERSQSRGLLRGINVLTGDQANRMVLRRWVRQSGGAFDVVIDDGGHLNSQVLTSWEELWPEVIPGGLYVLEDIHVGRHQDKGVQTELSGVESSFPAVSDVMQSWLDQLVHHGGIETYRIDGGAGADAFARAGVHSVSPGPKAADDRTRAARDRLYPLPPDVAFVACQPQACVIGKKDPASARCDSASAGSPQVVRTRQISSASSKGAATTRPSAAVVTLVAAGEWPRTSAAQLDVDFHGKHGGWVRGAVTLGASLRPVAGIDLLALCYAVSSARERVLQAVGWRCLRNLEMVIHSKSSYWKWDYTAKVVPFSLVQYERVVLLDSDVVVVRPDAITELLAQPIPDGHVLASRDCAATRLRFKDAEHELQGGVLVLQPNLDVYAQLLGAVNTTYSRDSGGQGFFSSFFRGKVSWIANHYNYVSNDDCVHAYNPSTGRYRFDDSLRESRSASANGKTTNALRWSQDDTEHLVRSHLASGAVGLIHFHGFPKAWHCSPENVAECRGCVDRGCRPIAALHQAWMDAERRTAAAGTAAETR